MRFASLHFPHHLALVVFLVLLLAVALGACSRPPQPKTQASASSGPSHSASVEKVSSSAGDAALTAKVKTALAGEAGLKTLKIDVDSNSGVVTLKGRVESDETKQRIQEVAQGVSGVKWVQNQISVAPKAS